MPTMELTSTNEEFAAATADIIELKGLAKGQYYDKWMDCYCTLGAFRILIFGTYATQHYHHTDLRVKRYLELVDWFADKLREPNPNDGRRTETVVGMWNDDSSKHDVIVKLREVGRAV